MRRIITSLLVVGVVGAVAIGATQAFFSDTETSTGNVLSAGSIDLTIDSTAHYDGLICLDSTEDQIDNPVWQDDPSVNEDTSRTELLGEACTGTWPESNLTDHRFFDLTDLKPGDFGENTISVHVDDNDAWFRAVLSNAVDSDNGCTEPELVAEPGCTTDGNGELDDHMTLTVWLDQGTTPGFQCNDPEADQGAGCVADPQEGDNIRQADTEPLVTVANEITPDGVVYDFTNYLSNVWTTYCSTAAADGHDGYGTCHGIAQDGRLVGSSVYYFGIGWAFDPAAGNEAQTDMLGADIEFLVEQHRNNPSPVFPTSSVSPTPTPTN